MSIPLNRFDKIYGYLAAPPNALVRSIEGDSSNEASISGFAYPLCAQSS